MNYITLSELILLGQLIISIINLCVELIALYIEAKKK